jgi:hypothetical protein
MTKVQSAGTSFSNSKSIPPQTTKARTTDFGVSTLQTAQSHEQEQEINASIMETTKEMLANRLKNQERER